MTTKDLENEGYDADSCPLCIQFDQNDLGVSFSGDIRCVGCPVREATGQVDCRHTPYSDAAQSLFNWSSGGQWSKEDQDNVEAEIRFLESLL